MRMWPVDPKVLCRKHLLGEHVEMHMFAGSLNKGIGMTGYIEGGQVDLSHIQARHDMLAEELSRRQFVHSSPLDSRYNTLWSWPLPDEVVMSQYIFRKKAEASALDLFTRCPECRARARALANLQESIFNKQMKAA